MSFLDPYAAGDPNPDDLNPRFMIYCVAGLAVCVLAWIFVDDLMLRLVVAAGMIGLITAISVLDVRQVESDDAIQHDRLAADRPTHTATPTRTRNQPLVRLSADASWEGRWGAARSRHDGLLVAWLPYETEPEKVLSYPTLSDVREEPTARFFDAMHDADVLRTDSYPGPVTSTEYIDAVRVLTQAWEGARRHALRTGMDGLEDSDRRALKQVMKLLRHAGAAKTTAERALYARRAHEMLSPMVRRGTVRLPDKLAARIESAARGAISAAPENT